MIKHLSHLLLCVVSLSLASAYAEDEAEYEVHASVELAKGVCADPNMTDEERGEMIDRSLEDAISCMGREWVYGDLPDVQTSSLGQLDIDANVSANRIRVTDRNGTLRVMLTSPGLPGKDTLTGEFAGPFRVENGNYKVQNPQLDYVGAPMPWAVFYNPWAKVDTGYAIHGTHAVGELGRPASHGCLRVTIANAKFINAQVREANDASAQIHVYGKVASRSKTPRRPRPGNEDDYYTPTPRYPRRPYPPADDDFVPRPL